MHTHREAHRSVWQELHDPWYFSIGCLLPLQDKKMTSLDERIKVSCCIDLITKNNHGTTVRKSDWFIDLGRSLAKCEWSTALGKMNKLMHTPLWQIFILTHRLMQVSNWAWVYRHQNMHIYANWNDHTHTNTHAYTHAYSQTDTHAHT